MDSRNISVLILIWLCLIREAVAVNQKSIVASRGFLIYRTISIIQRSCDCTMSFSCSCCQSVIILYTKREKNLCVNFTYQRNGLNVDVALSSDMISTRTVTNFKAFQFCDYVPGCLFSTACINILELNLFPRSITACLRLDIYAKKQLWQVNYDCISVSTELPMMSANGTTVMARNGQSTIGMMSNEMTSQQTSEMSSMETSGITEETEEITEMSEMISEGMIVD